MIELPERAAEHIAFGLHRGLPSNGCASALLLLALELRLQFLGIGQILCATACALVDNQVFHRDHRNLQTFDRKRRSLRIGIVELNTVDSSDDVDAAWAIANLEDDSFG
jgi:hypothetical protein